RTDDARLTLEVIKEAAKYGANITNYVQAIDFNYQNNKMTGVRAKDVLNDTTFDINAKSIVNATGPWVDDLRSIDHSDKNKHLQLSKGAHLVFSHTKFSFDQSMYFDTPDKPMVPAIPRDNKTHVSTPDTVYDGDPSDLIPTQDVRHYILNA